MKTNQKRAAYFSFLLFFILACRTYAFSAPQDIFPKGGEYFTCYGYYDSAKGTGYNCVIDCPSEENYGFDIEDLNTLNNRSDADIKAQYCPVDESTSSSLNPPPTEEPTEEPAPTEPPAETAPLKPFLTGNFTTCDNLARYVNFTIADDAPPYDPATINMLFNGQAVTCTPAASNSKTLTCIYPPAPYGPPASIEVYIGDERVNDFKFDGGIICDSAPQPNTDNTEEEQPAATEPPATDESTD